MNIFAVRLFCFYDLKRLRPKNHVIKCKNSRRINKLLVYLIYYLFTKFKFAPLVSISSKGSLDCANRFRLRLNKKASYFVMPEGVWRGPAQLVSGSALIPLKLPVGKVQNFYLVGNSWFLLKSPCKDGHGFLRSDDEGAKWQDMDDGLEVNSGNKKFRLIPTCMAWWDDVVFLNAGGGVNFMSSRDGGKQWSLLAGGMAIQMASPGKFLVRGQDVILGGEAPLDIAYLEKGQLQSDASSWTRKPMSVAPQGLSNRNVQFIEESPDRKILFAGVEGGLLKSIDSGNSWRWAQRFEEGDEKYPYIQHICFVSSQTKRIWVSGFDKRNGGFPYLSVSEDDGENWTDLSYAFAMNSNYRDALALQLDSQETIMIGVFDTKKMRVEVGVLTD